MPILQDSDRKIFLSIDARTKKESGGPLSWLSSCHLA